MVDATPWPLYPRERDPVAIVKCFECVFVCVFIYIYIYIYIYIQKFLNCIYDAYIFYIYLDCSLFCCNTYRYPIKIICMEIVQVAANGTQKFYGYLLGMFSRSHHE